MDKLDAKGKGESPLLVLRVPVPLLHELRARAERDGVTPSAAARDLLEKALGWPTSKARRGAR